MKTSVIIPVLNEAIALPKTLITLLDSEGDFEVIVVDGGSTDGTISGAESLLANSRFPFSILHAARGRAVQMNLGAAHAVGPALLFLHADTRLPKHAFAMISDCLERPAMIGGRFKVCLDQPGWRYRLIETSINLRDRLFRGFTGDQAIFIRSDVFRSMGGYRALPLMEDLDMAGRMCRRGRVARIPAQVTTSARRWQKYGFLRTILTMWTLRLLYVLGCPPGKLSRFYGDTR